MEHPVTLLNSNIPFAEAPDVRTDKADSLRVLIAALDRTEARQQAKLLAGPVNAFTLKRIERIATQRAILVNRLNELG